MGITAENVAKQWKVTREEQDAFARREPPEGATAIDAGDFKDEIVPYEIDERCPTSQRGEIATQHVIADTDEGPRPDTTLEALAKLKTVFARQGQRHRRQQLADVRRRRRGDPDEREGAEEIQPAAARRASSASRSRACRRRSWASARSRRSRSCSQQAGLKQDDLDWIELNEAFAAQALAVITTSASTRRRSIRRAAPSRSATRSAPPARCAPRRWCTA